MKAGAFVCRIGGWESESRGGVGDAVDSSRCKNWGSRRRVWCVFAVAR